MEDKMERKLKPIRDFSNFILIIIFFLSGSGAVVVYITVEKPQWLSPVDLAVGGFIACVIVGLFFFFRSLKHRGESV